MKKARKDSLHIFKIPAAIFLRHIIGLHVHLLQVHNVAKLNILQILQ